MKSKANKTLKKGRFKLNHLSAIKKPVIEEKKRNSVRDMNTRKKREKEENNIPVPHERGRKNNAKEEDQLRANVDKRWTCPEVWMNHKSRSILISVPMVMLSSNSLF